jgi:signal transduction histidine kinase
MAGSHQQMILINDILDMAKHEAGHLRLERESVDINDVFSAVKRTMSPIARQHNINLIVHSVALPPVYGDPDRISQMIINLTSNAIKFTNELGQIEIFAQADKDYAAISIKDTGEGIPPELLPHIFEKFRQGDSSSKRRRSGTGLGLALVKTLAELHGGRISVRSELSKGTQFTIYLPIANDKLGDI